PKNIAATWVLNQAFDRARTLLQANQLTADETVTAWLGEDCNQITLDQYLSADDGVFVYHLQRWQHHPDAVLADLCRRFLDRDLLKALEVSHLGESDRQALLDKVHYLLTGAGFVPNYYAGLRTFINRGYTLYQRGINLQTSTGLQEISELSPLVKTLTQPVQKVWLLYPREIEAELLAVIT
ncbi:MAG: phosphohydrolase, partial [Phormidesmis sp. CAN_BIN36]|nr:phosphohydrolase [Phormidesmis sp. CAN_BIN36]